MESKVEIENDKERCEGRWFSDIRRWKNQPEEILKAPNFTYNFE